TSAYRRIYPEANYTGHDWDDVLGMFYAKARFYDPAAKRFVAMDPVKGDVFEPMTLVPYIYCEDNPLKYVDPMGLMNYFTQTDDLLAGVGRGIYDSTIGAIINIPATGSMLVELVKGFVGGDIDFSELISILFETTLGDYRTVLTKIDTLDPFSKKTDEQVYEYGRAVGAVATDIVMTLVGGKIIDAAIDFLKQTTVGKRILALVDDFTKYADDVADVKTGSRGNGVDVDVGNGRGVDAGNTGSGKNYFDNSGNCRYDAEINTDKAVNEINNIHVKDTIGVKRVPRGVKDPAIEQTIRRLADQADKAYSGNGPRVGTLKHSELERLINNLNNKRIRAEVSFDIHGREVARGTSGSIRLDVVEYSANGTIVAVYDLKTGGAYLSDKRIAQIRQYLGMPDLPVIEIHP
ncbi:RHS repeat-associated core domain-containing protein, partial [Xylanibacter rodentium]|uniref:RHS repeat-associated core domain-containing protein n=1 Tax=Xylanibacter rodentium TaxID=2736289 RepID=UPI00259D29CD